jgi:biotin carboxyl carrier protein
MPVYEIFIDAKPRRIELTRTGENTLTARVDDRTVKVELPADKESMTEGVSIRIDGKAYRVKLPGIDREAPFSVRVEDVTFKAEVKTDAIKQASAISEPASLSLTKKAANRQVVEGAVAAPMTGKILSMRVKTGDQVRDGQVLCVLEAMKMENEITAPKGGTVREVYVSEGSSVNEGEPLLLVD